MKFNSTLALLILLLPVAVWILGGDGRLLPETRSLAPGGDFLASLGMEPNEKRLASDFSLKDIEGNLVLLHDLRGKVVLLNFWATWCPPCRFEMPSMQALHEKLSSQGLVVLAVAPRESAEDVRSFYNEHRLSFPALLDHEAEVSGLYKVWSLPTTFVINKHGYVVGKIIGYRDWNNDQSKDFFLHLLRDSTWAYPFQVILLVIPMYVRTCSLPVQRDISPVSAQTVGKRRDR
jgi:peroxiredoxin